MKTSNIVTLLAVAATAFVSCKNADIEFPDFDYSAAYFAYQYPVRTIVLGEDIYDTTLDNEHKFEVYATLSGMYENKKRTELSIKVDDSLCDNLYYEDGSEVTALPADYYQLASDKIVLDKVMTAGVGVQLTDKFFDDVDAINKKYVLPLRMTSATGVDSILMGKPVVEGSTPASCNPSDWATLPKDYVLYAVKFINPWHGSYLRSGKDVIATTAGESVEVTRKKEYVEYDEVTYLTTTALKGCSFTAKYSEKGLNDKNEEIDVINSYDMILTFDADNKCTISSDSSLPYSVTGSGKFVKDGEKNSWGGEDRDALYLDYVITNGDKTYTTTDVLVARSRGIKFETFTPSYN